MKSIVKKTAVIGASMLALGGVASVGAESVTPQKAEAYVVAFKVSSTSERSMRLCNGSNGSGGCSQFGIGHYAVHVGSARQDAGCEYWQGGVRKFERRSTVIYRNYPALYSKVTVALKNCRNTGRGDVAPVN